MQSEKNPWYIETTELAVGETVAAKIAASARRFDTSLDALRQLKSANVPEIVIRSMVKGGAR